MRPEKFRMLQIFLRVLLALLIGVPFGLWIWGKIPLYYSEIGLYISFVCAVFIETVLCGKYRKTGEKCSSQLFKNGNGLLLHCWSC